MEQIAADEYAVLRANQFVLQIVSDARALGSPRQQRGRETRGVCESYFSLWAAVSVYWSPLVQDLGMIPGYTWCPPRSPVDACALIIREWSAKVPGRGDELQCTGLLQDIIDSLQVDAAISSDLMDACVGALSSISEEEVFILQARDIVPVMDVLKATWDTENFARGANMCSTNGSVSQKSFVAAQSFQIFQERCAVHEKAAASILKVLDVLSAKRPTRIVVPLMIERGPVNGKPGVGHWITVEYDVLYEPAGHVGQNVVSTAYIRLGDSLRNGASALDGQYMFLLYALFRLGSGVEPQFVTEAKSNLTTATPPFGCGLPVQTCGNGCAVYTLATICATSSRLLQKAENRLESSYSMWPFTNVMFDGCGESKGRAMVACLALVRLYQFGKYFEWTQYLMPRRSLFVKYQKWERQQSVSHGGTFMDGAVLLRGEFPFEDVISGEMNLATTGFEACLDTRKTSKFHLRAEFIKIITAGVRTCVRTGGSMRFERDSSCQGACTFYSVPRKYTGFAKGDASGKTATSKVVKVRKTYFEHGTWYCNRKNGLCTAGETKCRTSMKIEHYPQSNLVRVFLHLHPGFKLSEVFLPQQSDDGSFPLGELLG
jgi:hypothetical protein